MTLIGVGMISTSSSSKKSNHYALFNTETKNERLSKTNNFEYMHKSFIIKSRGACHGQCSTIVIPN